MNEEQKVERTAPLMPKKFGAIYYSALGLALVLLLIFSFVTYYFAGASVSTSVDVNAAHANAVALARTERNTYAKNTLSSAVEQIDGWLSGIDGLTRVTATKSDGTVDKEDGEDQKITAALADGSTYTVQDFEALDYTLDLDTVGDMTHGDYAGYEANILASRQVKNFIVTIPGSGDDAVLFMTHYDSAPGSVGASSASAVAAMIGTVEALVSEDIKPINDLVFVITEGRYESSVGAYAFRNQFEGFDKVCSRVKAAFNFDAITAGGALTLIQSSEGDSGIMSGYLMSGASVRTDSSVASLMDGDLTSDFDIFYDFANGSWRVPALNFMTTAGSVTAGSSGDNTENVGENVTAQYASAMDNLARHFGFADLDGMAAGAESATATYLGAGFGMHGVAVYVIAALLVVLLIGTLVVGAKKKAFGLENTFKGAAGVLISLALSLGAFFIAYFLIGLLTVAFGAASMNMLFTAHLLTPAVLLPAILFAAVVQCGIFPIAKRGLKVKAGDCVRGGAVLQILTAAVFGFVNPSGALPFIIIAIGNVAVMLASALLKDLFRAKFGFGMERLFLYTVPAIFGLPLLIQATMVVSNLFATISMPFMLVAIAMLLTSITPYFDYLQPVLADAFYKLPKHTVPVVEVVSEEREDAAKKGKFETVTETKVVRRKVAWNYHNWFGVTVLTVLTVIALLIGAPVSSAVNISGPNNFVSGYDFRMNSTTDSIFDDSVVCYVDGSVSGSGRYYWLIKDENVYQSIKGLAGYDYWEWTYDDNLGAYKKEVATEAMPSFSSKLFDKSTETEGKTVIDVSPTYVASSQVRMRLSNLRAGDKITVIKNDDTDYVLTVSNPASYVTLELPYGYGNCTIEIETSSSSILVDGYEYSNSPVALNLAYEHYADMEEYFATLGKELGIGFMLRGTA